MKNNLRMFLMIAVCVVIFGCATKVSAQVEPPMVGGYNKVDVADKEVMAATNFAVRKQSKTQKSAIKLVAVNSAAQQVVAGMNYQMCLSVETTDRKTKKAMPQTVQIVVFRNLKGKYELTSWAVAACTDAAPISAPTD